MKYLLKWKMTSPPSEELRPSRSQHNEKRQDEKKYGKVLFPAHMMGNIKGITIVECDKDQLINRLTLTPWLEYEVYPLVSSEEMWRRE